MWRGSRARQAGRYAPNEAQSGITIVRENKMRGHFSRRVFGLALAHFCIFIVWFICRSLLCSFPIESLQPPTLIEHLSEIGFHLSTIAFFVLTFPLLPILMVSLMINSSMSLTFCIMALSMCSLLWGCLLSRALYWYSQRRAHNQTRHGSSCSPIV